MSICHLVSTKAILEGWARAGAGGLFGGLGDKVKRSFATMHVSFGCASDGRHGDSDLEQL